MNKRKCSPSGGSRQKGGHLISLVYFLGFTETDIADIKNKAQREVEYSEQLTSDVTHIIFNDKAVSEISNYITKFFFAAISGCWVIRPGWLLADSHESNFALAANNLEYMFSKSSSTHMLQEILKLCEFYATSKLQIFNGPIFHKVLFLQSANEDDELKSDIRSILEAAGASFVPYSVVKNLKMKGKNDKYVTIATTFTKNPDLLDKSLIKLLVDAGVPVIFYEAFLDYIKQKREPQLSDLLEISESLWNFDHLCQVQSTSSNSSMMSTTELDTADNSRQRSSYNFFLSQPIGAWLDCQPVFDSWMDYMNITPHCKTIMATLKEKGHKTFYQSVESINNFAQIIGEFQLNTKDKEVSCLICYSAVSYLTNSERSLFLPTPTAVSFLFHKVMMGDCNELLDTKNTAFTYIKCLIQKYPPHDPESRLYWIQALSFTERNDEDEFERSESDVREILQNVRGLLEKVFEKDPINEDVIAILLEILEIDLYFFEIGSVRGPKQLHTANNLKNMDLLLTNPLAYLVVDDLGYAYGRGLDKRSKEFLMLVSKTVSSLEHTALQIRHIPAVSRLHIVFLEAIYFTRQQGENEANIREDLSLVIRRMIQWGVERSILYEYYPIQWIHNILRSIR